MTTQTSGLKKGKQEDEPPSGDQAGSVMRLFS
jgi:hypothetical protein